MIEKCTSKFGYAGNDDGLQVNMKLAPSSAVNFVAGIMARLGFA